MHNTYCFACPILLLKRVTLPNMVLFSDIIFSPRGIQKNQQLSAFTLLLLKHSVGTTPSKQIKHCPLLRLISITTQTFLPVSALSKQPEGKQIMYGLTIILKARGLFYLDLIQVLSCDNHLGFLALPRHPSQNPSQEC